MFVFDAMLGKVNYYGSLPDSTDSIVLVPFEVGTEVDEDLKALATLNDLTAVLTESAAGRVTATSASVANGIASLVNTGWTAPASGPQITRIAVCYVPSSGAADTAIIPMVSIDVDWTPDGVLNFTIDMESGYFQAVGYEYA